MKRTKRKTRLLDSNTEDIRRLYCEDNMRLDKLANLYCCSVLKLKEFMISHQIPFREKIDQNLVNLEFGYFKVIERASSVGTPYEKSGNSIWWCQCKCGNRVLITRTEILQNKRTKCVECHRKEHGRWIKNYCIEQRSTNYELLSGTYYSQIRYAALNRGILFDATKEYLWNLFEFQDRKCRLSGQSLEMYPFEWEKNRTSQTCSLNCLNPGLGYIDGNLQWLHKNINAMKFDFAQSDFLRWCFLVARYTFNEDKYSQDFEIDKSYFHRILAGAKTRNLEFNITIDNIHKLFIKQGGKCKLSGIPLNFAVRHYKNYKDQDASVDRLDSSLGYSLGNIQIVHKTINIMKGEYLNKEFIEYCKMIDEHTSGLVPKEILERDFRKTMSVI